MIQSSMGLGHIDEDSYSDTVIVTVIQSSMELGHIDEGSYSDPIIHGVRSY